jgi:hypothetical protein
MKPNLSLQIIDVLETDGGWLTVDGIALVIGKKPSSVKRTLYKLGEVVERRTVLLAAHHRAVAVKYGSSVGGDTHDSRSEWRLA